MIEFNVKNRFHVREDQSVKNIFDRYKINIALSDVPLSESMLWPFANCIPRTVILHERVLSNGSMSYDCADDASWGVLTDIHRFLKNLPEDWEPHQLRHALETKVRVYIIDAEVENIEELANAIRN